MNQDQLFFLVFQTAPTTLPSSSWVNLQNQMRISILQSTILGTTYVRYLSHYCSSSWSNKISFPPAIRQTHLDSKTILDFEEVSQGFSCSFISETTTPWNIGHGRTFASSARFRGNFNVNQSAQLLTYEKEFCLKFFGPLNVLLTPLMLDCLTAYLDKWKTYREHPISILDDLQIRAQANSSVPKPSTDQSATKFSIQIPQINLCCLQAGLAEDTVQLTELRRPIDIVTMSLIAASCRQIQIETILSNKAEQSTAVVAKIQSITSQLRRLENEFSSMDQIHVDAIQSERCRLQFQIPLDSKTHLPIGENRNHLGFVMNEYSLQRICFKLVNNAAKEKEKKMEEGNVTQVQETPTASKSSSKSKSKKKMTTETVNSLLNDYSIF